MPAEQHDEEPTWYANRRKPHPLCVMARELRQANGMSLAQFEAKTGFPAVVLGAYERGDRVPPLSKLEVIFRAFGYALTAVPIGTNAVRLPVDVVADLRAIADQLEARETGELLDNAA